MNRAARWTALMLALPGLTACSGLGTAFSKAGRMRQNRGYEVSAVLPLVQQAAMAVLKGHGYEVSVKPDPTNGAESAGMIVIGQRLIRYDAVPDAARQAQPQPLQTRDLVDVYVSKKWQFSSDQGAPDLTLVDIVGGSYLLKAPGAAEEERPLTPAFIGELRSELERGVDALRGAQAAQ